MIINENSFIIIYTWMNTRLHLKGTDEKVFAFLHGFIKGVKDQAYSGSIEYIYKTLGISKRACLMSLDNLIKKGLIYKAEKSCVGCVKHYEFYENLENLPDIASAKIVSTSAKNAPDTSAEIAPVTSAKIAPNNIVYNSIINNNIEKEYSSLSDIEEILKSFNEICKTSFTKKSLNNETIQFIQQYPIKEIERVIKNKYEEWSKSPKMKIQIKPSVILKEKNFLNYIEEKEITTLPDYINNQTSGEKANIEDLVEFFAPKKGDPIT